MANCYFQGKFFRPPSKMLSRTPMIAIALITLYRNVKVNYPKSI